MVEMRWLKIDYPPPAGTNPAATPDSSGRFCRVLQYRYDRSTTAGIRNWSDWIDVPTVAVIEDELGKALAALNKDK